MLVARGYNFACIKKRSNCITVPALLSMIVGQIGLHYFLKNKVRVSFLIIVSMPFYLNTMLLILLL